MYVNIYIHMYVLCMSPFVSDQIPEEVTFD